MWSLWLESVEEAGIHSYREYLVRVEVAHFSKAANRTVSEWLRHELDAGSTHIGFLGFSKSMQLINSILCW